MIIAIECSEDSDLGCVQGLLQGFGAVGSPDWPEVDELLGLGDRLMGCERVALVGIVSALLVGELVQPKFDQPAPHGLMQTLAAVYPLRFASP